MSSTHYSNDDSTEVYGTQTAVAATTDIVTSPAILVPGLYEVRVAGRVSTGANPSLADNMRIETSPTTVSRRRLIFPIVAATSTQMLSDTVTLVRVTSNQVIRVRSVGAETASVVYAVSMVYRKVAD